jgi:predicted protein tyrosine phosphatase
MKHVLFICSGNRLRSPTAEQVFAEWPGVETASAGMSNDADQPVTAELLEWEEEVGEVSISGRRERAGRVFDVSMVR